MSYADKDRATLWETSPGNHVGLGVSVEAVITKWKKFVCVFLGRGGREIQKCMLVMSEPSLWVHVLKNGRLEKTSSFRLRLVPQLDPRWRSKWVTLQVTESQRSWTRRVAREKKSAYIQCHPKPYQVLPKILHPDFYLVGGLTNPSEKYATVKLGIISPIYGWT